MNKEITSTQNALIKELFLLKTKGRARRKSCKFLVEGMREIQLAYQGNYDFDKVLIDPLIITDFEDKSTYDFLRDSAEIIAVSSDVYKKLALRESTEGIIAVCKSKELRLDSLDLKHADPLLLVVESIEKPGNLGALFRTADAAGVDAVLIANPRCDIFNPNVIRSSVGCVFTNNIAVASSAEIISYLKDRDIEIFTASLQASVPYETVSYRGSSAIVVGTEATGLSELWYEHSDQSVKICMHGKIDSMNVSVSAAILIFEAIRQRKNNI